MGLTQLETSNLSLNFLKILKRHNNAFFLTNKEYLPSFSAILIISLWS